MLATVRRDDYQLRWINPWSRVHTAKSDRECDHCGGPIKFGDDYVRHVGIMTRRKREYWVIENFHTNTGCNAP
jgi:hypothetical protein